MAKVDSDFFSEKTPIQTGSREYTLLLRACLDSKDKRANLWPHQRLRSSSMVRAFREKVSKSETNTSYHVACDIVEMVLCPPAYDRRTNNEKLQRRP